MAQREYDEKLIPSLERVVSKLKEIETIYDDGILGNCFQKMCNARKKLVAPFIEPIDMKINRFMNEMYEPSIFEEDDKTEFYTLRNERVRSKSEIIIADELYRYEIPYRYEMPLILENWGKSVIFRPDFTVMNKKNGKIYIWEHFGMMDNPEYIEKSIRKLDVYEKNGFFLGVNLLLSHETSKVPLSRIVLDSYIDYYLL